MTWYHETNRRLALPTLRCRRQGFTLVEVVLVVAISSVVLCAVLGALVALLRGLQPPRVTIQGEILPIAPTFGSFPSAVRLHQALTDRLVAARAIYVFGGRHVSIPATAPEAQQRPLKTQALPVIKDFSAGLPLDAKGFYDRYAAALGEAEVGGSPEDFSVAIVGPNAGALALTCWVQVCHTDVTVSDGAESTAFVVRDVRLWDIDGTMQRYAYAEQPAKSGQIFTGAVHTWFRYSSNHVAEEGPVCAVFPDPWVYAGSRGRSGDAPAFSRFSYLLAVSP